MDRSRISLFWSSMVLMASVAAACRDSHEVAARPADLAFDKITREILEDRYRRHPSQATDLGIHRYDERMEDRSPTAIKAESEALRRFRSQLSGVDPATLGETNALDRDMLLRTLDAGVLALDAIRMWEKDPDAYSSDVTNAVHVIVKRPYAPAVERLKAVIAREKQIPSALQVARSNLTAAVAVYTRIAIEQIDGNIGFFKADVPAAFADVHDQGLLGEFKRVNDETIASLEAYKRFLTQELLPRAKTTFAYGADLYARALAANEMVEVPLDRLLTVAEADRQHNEGAFEATARRLDAGKPPAQVLTDLQLDHPPPERLLSTTQSALDTIRRFVVDRRIVTIPPSNPVTVKETPPFLRSTTSASMDTPGPFETAHLDGYYYMTLPDPRQSPTEQADYMRQWYDAAISNVSVHEVYPGHYIQFLYAKSFPSDVRRVFGANTNIEGWAHYAEQMMLDEGFHIDDPRYRLAELQDALLRDVRLIVGIKMHTEDMTVEQATQLFETAAYQPHPVAVAEAKRGTSDALYGYYTLGKLMILKLREDYRAKTGAQYSLQRFHDSLMKLGPLPLPLVRKTMLGEVGRPL
jgi:uncharacterized protein (DUF885 family)